jgi:hypothetical protein
MRRHGASAFSFNRYGESADGRGRRGDRDWTVTALIAGHSVPETVSDHLPPFATGSGSD